MTTVDVLLTIYSKHLRSFNRIFLPNYSVNWYKVLIYNQSSILNTSLIISHLTKRDEIHLQVFTHRNTSAFFFLKA